MKLKEETDVQCYHCNTTCNHDIQVEEKVFCCEGCKSVYLILNQSNLCDYYKYRDASTLDIKPASNTGKFLFLDDEKVIARLLRFREGDTAVVQFYIPSIHCSACIWLLEHLGRLNDAVGNVQVNFQKKEALIHFNIARLSLRELTELLAGVGYEPLISLEDGRAKKRTVSRTLIYRLGVAGFAFGNIMLMSFPEYLGAALYKSEYLKVFPWLNLLLSIPVLVYSGWIYLDAAVKGLRKGLLNIDLPIALGMLVLFGRSAYEIISETGAGYLDSLAGLVFFLLIGRWYQERTYSALSFDRDYAAYFPLGVTMIEDGKEKGIALEDVRPGMRLVMRNNDLIPADGILVEGHARIDYSFVTGESDTIGKNPGELLYAGGRQKGSAIELIVEKAPDQSYLTSLWSARNDDAQPEGVAAVAEHVSRRFTVAILAISAVAAGVWAAIDPSQIALVVTSVLIVACPCALALSVPFAYGTAMRVLSKKGVYLRSSQTIQQFNAIDHLIFDKTGTLTSAEQSQVNWHGPALNLMQAEAISAITRSSSHPLSRMIHTNLNTRTTAAPTDFAETAGQGITAGYHNQAWQLGSAAMMGIPSSESVNNRSYVKQNGEVIGYFEFVRPFRGDLKPMMRDLQARYALHVLSGDGSRDGDRISAIFPAGTALMFQQSPAEKQAYVARLQEQGHAVCMVGDGLNDAGAIMQSDLGISVAEEAWHFTPASDVIVTVDQLTRLPELFRFAAQVKKTVQLSFLISLAYNVVGISVAVSGELTPLFAAVLMPLSSVTIVAFVSLRTLMRARAR
jgi:Cu+-exporting ATPase